MGINSMSNYGGPPGCGEGGFGGGGGGFVGNPIQYNCRQPFCGCDSIVRLPPYLKVHLSFNSVEPDTPEGVTCSGDAEVETTCDCDEGCDTAMVDSGTIADVHNDDLLQAINGRNWWLYLKSQSLTFPPGQGTCCQAGYVLIPNVPPEVAELFNFTVPPTEPEHDVQDVGPHPGGNDIFPALHGCDENCELVEGQPQLSYVRENLHAIGGLLIKVCQEDAEDNYRYSITGGLFVKSMKGISPVFDFDLDEWVPAQLMPSEDLNLGFSPAGAPEYYGEIENTPGVTRENVFDLILADFHANWNPQGVAGGSIGYRTPAEWASCGEPPLDISGCVLCFEGTEFEICAEASFTPLIFNVENRHGKTDECEVTISY